MENKTQKFNLIDEILDTIKQEIRQCQLFRPQDFTEANYIYNMIKEIITVREQEFQQIKDKKRLTLTEAIIHARHVEQFSDLCEEYRAEHGQLADWLEELREYRCKEMEDKILNPKNSKSIDNTEEV